MRIDRLYKKPDRRLIDDSETVIRIAYANERRGSFTEGGVLKPYVKKFVNVFFKLSLTFYVLNIFSSSAFKK